MQTKITELEIWRTSPYEGYSVSTLGNVRNDKTGHILKPGTTKLGYQIVTVGGQSRYVHQLVMNTFMPISKAEASTLSDIDHIDSCRFNNKLSNLRRCTHADNLRSEHRLALIRHACIAIDKDGAVIMQASSMTKMAELLNVTEATISTHVNNGLPLSTGLKVVRADTDKQANTAKEVA